MYEQEFFDEYLEENPARDSDVITDELVMLDISENAGFDFDADFEAVVDEDFIEMYNINIEHGGEK